MAFAVRTFLDAHQAHFVVGLLAVVQPVVVALVDVAGHQVVEVGAVVVDMYLAETIDEGEVAVAVDAADALGADGDEVAVVDVAQVDRGIAEDGACVDVYLVAADGDVAAGEDGIVDDDTVVVELGPCGSSIGSGLVFQLVEVADGHVVTLLESAGERLGREDDLADAVCALYIHGVAHGAYVFLGLAPRLDDHAAVQGHTIGYVVLIVIVTAAIGRKTVATVDGQGVAAFLLAAAAEDVAHVAAAEDVAVAERTVGLHHVVAATYLAATDTHLRATEDVTLRAEVHQGLLGLGHVAIAAPAVVAAAATEDVAHDVAAVQVDVGAA